MTVLDDDVVATGPWIVVLDGGGSAVDTANVESDFIPSQIDRTCPFELTLLGISLVKVLCEWHAKARVALRSLAPIFESNR